MDALIVTATSIGLALTMLLIPAVFVAIAMLSALFLLLGASAAVLAYLVDVPVAGRRLERRRRQEEGSTMSMTRRSVESARLWR